MDFGRLDDVTGVDFRLPKDGFDAAGLWGGNPAKKLRVEIAPPSWGIKTWVGKIYPPKTPAIRYLQEFGKQYGSIEHNGTRYGLPSYEQTKTWAAQVPDGFLFCPKFPELITHRKQLKDCEDLTDQLLHNLNGFGNKLGTSLLLVHPNVSVNMAPKLYAYLKLLGGRVNYALELRHPSWFEDKAALEDLRAFLTEEGQGLVITDVAGRRDAVHMAPTNKEVFVRWTGNSLHPSDYERLDDWTDRLTRWISLGVKTVYFFIHQPAKTLCPESCSYLTQRLNEKAGLSLRDAQYYYLP